MSLSLDIRLAREGFSLDFQAEIAVGGITALFGPSGCGKTTVLRVVAGLEPGVSGHVSLDGEEWQGETFLPPHRRGAGYVFQDARLFPHLNVSGNLAYAVKRARVAPDYDRIISALDLAPLLSRRPDGLSGGEKQRVAIGRALLVSPRVLLLDEPMAALDENRKEEVMPYIERLREMARIPILLVSHSLPEVARLCTDMVVMREGRALRSGPLDELLADPAFAPVIGPSMAGAILSGRIIAHHEDGLSELLVSDQPVLLPRVEAPVGALVRFRVRADDVILGIGPVSQLSALNSFAAEVEEVHAGAGPGAMVALRLGDQRLLARLTRRSLNAMALQPGTPCTAIVKSVAVTRAEVGAAEI